MVLEDKLFHSVTPYNNPLANEWLCMEEKLQILKIKLERIFETQMLLNRDEITRNFKKNNFCMANYNHGNLISIAKHPSKRSYYDEDEFYVDSLYKGDSAWEIYTLEQVTLILAKRLLKVNELETQNVRMPLELQLRKPISLEYLEGIAIPTKKITSPFFGNCSLNKIIKEFQLFPTWSFYYKSLDIVLEVLKKYSISVPVVDIETGIEYHDNPEYRELIRKLIK